MELWCGASVTHGRGAEIFPRACRYICVVRKAYQERDSVISTVTTKVKGFAFTNTSDMDARLWDVADYVIPPQVCIVATPEGRACVVSWCYLRVWCFHRVTILSLL